MACAAHREVKRRRKLYCRTVGELIHRQHLLKDQRATTRARQRGLQQLRPCCAGSPAWPSGGRRHDGVSLGRQEAEKLVLALDRVGLGASSCRARSSRSRRRRAVLQLLRAT